jgi:hypothetical protein
MNLQAFRIEDSPHIRFRDDKLNFERHEGLIRQAITTTERGRIEQ